MQSGPGSAQQEGAAIVVVLFLLLIVTLLGLASMRGAILQERMAGATYGRSLAFQAAESALREAENWIAGLDTRPPIPASGCSAGLCAQPAPGATPAWSSSSFWDTAANSRPASTGMNNVSAGYIVEDYGRAESDECAAAASGFDMGAPPCTASLRVYRIVSRATTTGGAEVMLQSLFRAP